MNLHPDKDNIATHFIFSSDHLYEPKLFFLALLAVESHARLGVMPYIHKVSLK
jgi:hypothetical protein